MSLELFIHRDYRDPTCTMGIITNGVKSLQTMERPWVFTPDSPAGLKGQSCVPPGRYRLERHSTDAHSNVWALINHALDVYHWESEIPASRKGKARSVVLIHAANRAEELKGCIAPGIRRVRWEPKVWAVESSRDALNQVRTWIGSSLDVYLTIDEEKLKA